MSANSRYHLPADDSHFSNIGSLHEQHPKRPQALSDEDMFYPSQNNNVQGVMQLNHDTKNVGRGGYNAPAHIRHFLGSFGTRFETPEEPPKTHSPRYDPRNAEQHQIVAYQEHLSSHPTSRRALNGPDPSKCRPSDPLSSSRTLQPMNDTTDPLTQSFMLQRWQAQTYQEEPFKAPIGLQDFAAHVTSATCGPNQRLDDHGNWIRGASRTSHFCREDTAHNIRCTSSSRSFRRTIPWKH